MKIVVIGGTGLIGSSLVELCAGWPRTARGGLTPASTRSRARGSPRRSRARFRLGRRGGAQTSSRPRSRPARRRDGRRRRGHHVALSVVGAERLPESGYMRAKVAQEDLVKAGPIPSSAQRSSSSSSAASPIRARTATPSGCRRPCSARGSRRRRQHIGRCRRRRTSERHRRAGGSEAFRLDELAQRVPERNGDRREVTADVHAATSAPSWTTGRSPPATTRIARLTSRTGSARPPSRNDPDPEGGAE